jgi:transcriptional regulator GlxA family with amidase domain
MKTCFYQTVESSPDCIHPPISVPTTVPCIPGGTTLTNRKFQSLHPSFDHRQLVQQVVQYMMEHIDRPISIDMLCAALYVSRRTLHNAFREVVGVGPMTYLKTQRMKQVHQQLEQTHPLATTVFDTAYQWGFYHMGHFSRDYKQMFGESPSDTLRREPT